MWEVWTDLENPLIVKSYILKNLPEIETSKKYYCPCCKEEISFIKEHNKEKGLWRAHFAHHPNSKCEGYIPKGESPEHYEIKMRTLDLLTNKQIGIIIGNGKLQYFLQTEHFDIISEETPCINERRPDILLKLKSPDAIFGNGIVIEIMVSEAKKSVIEKYLDYSKKGYSLAWTNDGEYLTMQYTYPEVLIQLLNLKKEEFTSFVENLKILHKDFFKKAQANNWSCLNCAYSEKSKKYKGFIVCWKKYNKQIKNKIDILEKADFTPCEFYKPTYRTPIEEEEPEANFTCKRVME